MSEFVRERLTYRDVTNLKRGRMRGREREREREWSQKIPSFPFLFAMNIHYFLC